MGQMGVGGRLALGQGGKRGLQANYYLATYVSKKGGEVK